MAVDLKGKVTNQAGADKVGLTVELWEAAIWEAPGARTAVTTTDADGIWQFLAQDATKTWIVVVIDGTKKYLIDARNRIQLSSLDLITNLNVDTINEHTAAAGVTIDGVKLKDSEPYCDAIQEKTAAAGVTVDGLLIKDGMVGGIPIP